MGNIDDQNRNPTKNNREHLVGRPTTLRPQRLGLSFPFTTQTNSLQLKQQMMNILVIGNHLPILNCPGSYYNGTFSNLHTCHVFRGEPLLLASLIFSSPAIFPVFAIFSVYAICIHGGWVLPSNRGWGLDWQHKKCNLVAESQVVSWWPSWPARCTLVAFN